MIRAKRSLVLNRQIPFNNNDLTKSSTTEKESMIFHHQIKRIKTTHRSTFDSAENNIESKSINGTSTKRTMLKRWFIPLLFIITILVYFDLFNLTKISIRLNSNSPSKVFPKETIHLVNHNIIFQYGQFVRNHFFSSLDLLLTFLGQLFFSY
jgi:lipopolysaccharide/colanic/teichoic acid biosynthesis glycosyltransferase